MYVYNADTYCDSCGEAIRKSLAYLNIDADDEYSYDSDHYPKFVFGDYPADSPDHCASQKDCLEAIDLREYGLEDNPEILVGAESFKIGALLSDDLTAEGWDYLEDMLNENPRTPYQEALHTFWHETFEK